MVKRNSGGHKIRVGIDEAWRMIKYPDALDFLITGFRRARKKNTSFVVISQQFDEFFSEDTKPIIKNSDTKLFLPPDKTSVDSIKEVFKLTEGQADFLRVCKRGEGLLVVNNTSVKLNIEIPEFEFDFVETNQNAQREKRMAGVGA
jgi:type IV secretory pathway VirB4 component